MLNRDMLLRSLEKVLEKHPELEYTFYGEFSRRFEVLKIILRYIKPPANLVEAGASPFLLSAMLKLAGYNVVALDIEPEEYMDVAEMFNVRVVKCDLERDRIPLPDESFDIVVMSEVIEHLNPYYIPYTFSELNRILKYNGVLVITTPNIASLFRRLNLLIGRSPIYKLHVREYTLDEIVNIIEFCGFTIIEKGYLEVNDRCFLEAKSSRWLRRLPYIHNYLDMLNFVLHNITVNNILRVLAYPLVKVKKLYECFAILFQKSLIKQNPQKLEDGE